jgi:hypothetical protein
MNANRPTNEYLTYVADIFQPGRYRTDMRPIVVAGWLISGSRNVHGGQLSELDWSDVKQVGQVGHDRPSNHHKSMRVSLIEFQSTGDTTADDFILQMAAPCPLERVSIGWWRFHWKHSIQVNFDEKVDWRPWRLLFWVNGP